MRPDGSGFEPCQSLHNLSYTARIPSFIVTGESANKYRDYLSNLGAVGYLEKRLAFVKVKSRLASELQIRLSERRAQVRVPMKLILKLKGTDASQPSSEQLTATENGSAGGFWCTRPLHLSGRRRLPGLSIGSRSRALCWHPPGYAQRSSRYSLAALHISIH